MKACDLPIMAKKCATCPFGDNDVLGVRENLQLKIMAGRGSPICHSTGRNDLGLKNKKVSSQDQLCRGARDFALMIFHRLGVIAEPTDAAWEDAAKKLG